ncbi:hypothetical protein pEaSNUABM29_00248 [Erwinia phage pEa_SNUABM_29]|nr:hypothetical protein pEaSNUABM29_00248 [Erwinia phage pEa_SNUABM_29]
MNTSTISNARNEFFTQVNVNPERIRTILSTAWKLKQLGELTLNRENDWPAEATDIVNSIHSEWVDAVMQTRQLDVYYRMINAGYTLYTRGFFSAHTFVSVPGGREDTSLDHAIVNNFWGDQIEILELSTGERIPAHEVFSTNAEMYQPYATIRGKKVPVISLMHMGL